MATAIFKRLTDPANFELSGEAFKREFFYEFGQFIFSFALVESAVHELFRRVSGIKEERARVLVAGQDIGRMLEFTKKMSEVIPKSKFSQKNRVEMEFLFNQISEIAVIRGALVHWQSRFEDKKVRAIGFSKAKARDKIQEFTFGIEHIQDARYDLGSIYLRLMHLVKADKDSRKYVVTLRRTPWRYKPLKAGNWWTRTLADFLKRFPPPQSFQASQPAVGGSEG